MIVDTIKKVIYVKKKKRRKKQKFPSEQTIHCVVIPLTGRVPAIRLFSADRPLDFTLHYKDVV